MTTKKIQCTIKGISPLLMHAYPMQPIEAIEKKSPEEQAEYSAYRDPNTDAAACFDKNSHTNKGIDNKF
jgi:hypothetical protein